MTNHRPAGLSSPPRVALGRAPLRRSSLSHVHWTCSSTGAIRAG